jgi:hypothetical protein
MIYYREDSRGCCQRFKDRWMKWEQGALSGKVLTQIPNPVRNPEEDYYENDPLYYNGARRQGTYQ